jgi:hypothetical protein
MDELCTYGTNLLAVRTAASKVSGYFDGQFAMEKVDKQHNSDELK